MNHLAHTPCILYLLRCLPVIGFCPRSEGWYKHITTHPKQLRPVVLLFQGNQMHAFSSYVPQAQNARTKHTPLMVPASAVICQSLCLTPHIQITQTWASGLKPCLQAQGWGLEDFKLKPGRALNIARS